MDAIIGISIVVAVVLALTVLVRFIIVRTSKSQNFSIYSWVISGVMGFLWLFFMVFAQIQAAEAEKQAKAATAAQTEAQMNAEEAMKNADEAMRQTQIANENLRMAQELNARLEECNN